MKKRIVCMIVTCAVMVYGGSSFCFAADVKVMFAIGLLDKGEHAKLLTTEEFHQTVSDYEKFRERVAKATTLKAMVQNGWTIAHVEQIKAGGGDPYRQQNYLIIFQGQ